MNFPKWKLLRLSSQDLEFQEVYLWGVNFQTYVWARVKIALSDKQRLRISSVPLIVTEKENYNLFISKTEIMFRYFKHLGFDVKFCVMWCWIFLSMCLDIELV